MTSHRESDQDPRGSRHRPATTPEGRESQMVYLATSLAEKQIREGTASAQVISHYLKLGSSREKLEQQRLEYENKLTEAKIENMASQSRIEELYSEAIMAMNTYQGRPATNVENEVDE
jgi:hypothetical protein